MPSAEIINILNTLVPGFLAALIFHSLTPVPRRDVLDRIVNALLFTVLIQFAVQAFKFLAISVGSVVSVGRWHDQATLSLSLTFAVVFSVLVSWALHNDCCHAFLRKFKLTSRTSLSNEWYSAFSQTDGLYCILNMTGGRRLLGWAQEWPDSSEKGHFWIHGPVWLLDDGSEIDMCDVHSMLIQVNEVELVEFLKSKEDVSRVLRSGEIDQNRKKLIKLRKEGCPDECTE